MVKTMEELLASQNASGKLLVLARGQEVEGEIVAKTDKELVLDLGTKSEGTISTRDIPKDRLESLKLGDKFKAYVIFPENESGQVVLALERQTTRFEGAKDRLRGGKSRGGKFRGERVIDWSRFIQAQNQKSKLQGKVLEVNKGGLIVEVSGARGFLPNSQVGFELLAKTRLPAGRSTTGMEGLIGQDMTVSVIEVDENNNRLIFTQRGQISPEILNTLKGFKNGQKVLGKIVAILPFGLVVDLGGVEGLVFISDVSWDKVEDLNSLYKAGGEIEALVLDVDEELGRLNLSIKHLSEDPFGKLAEAYPTDEIVKGEIIDISDAGVSVKLKDAEGFLPVSKIKPGINYEVGASEKFLVDEVDSKRRRVNLAPFVTSTEGLIYK